MAPKKPLKTGGKAGAVPGRPGKPMAGLRDKSARVPASWNAKTVDPTNQRGAGQRPTGGMAGGRAGKPAGKIAGQTPKSASAKPTAKPSGQFTAPSVPKPGTATKPQGTPQAQKWVRENTLNARVSRAQQAQNPLNRIGNTIAQAGKSGVGKNLTSLAKNVGAGLIRNAKTGLAGAVAGAASDGYLSPLARKAGTALGKNVVIPAARALDNAMPGINSRDERMRSNSKAAKTGNKSRFAGKRAEAMAKAKGIKGSPVLGPKIVGPKKVGSGGGGGGTIAQAFDKSFASARKAGKATFMFRGKKYTTEMK